MSALFSLWGHRCGGDSEDISSKTGRDAFDILPAVYSGLTLGMLRITNFGVSSRANGRVQKSCLLTMGALNDEAVSGPK